MQFLPNGYQLATASDDNTVKIWDLRKKSNVQIVAAHNKLISDVKFSNDGSFMLTSSYDQTAKVWAAGAQIVDQCPLVRTLANGHDNKVTSVCFTQDMKYILTTSFDRTFKLWKQ